MLKATLMIAAAIALPNQVGAQVAATPPTSQSASSSAPEATWFLIYADRSGMVGISKQVVKQGISGAYTTMLIVNPEPAADKPNVVDDKMEFDCIAGSIRTDGGVAIRFGEAPKTNMMATNWEKPVKGSNLDLMWNFACHDQASPNWVDTRLGLDDLISFYFIKILGVPDPSK